ncbi:MAG: hypothetical protein AB7J40_05580 [Candidatus Altimarinota bacterium]
MIQKINESTAYMISQLQSYVGIARGRINGAAARLMADINRQNTRSECLQVARSGIERSINTVSGSLGSTVFGSHKAQVLQRLRSLQSEIPNQ